MSFPILIYICLVQRKGQGHLPSIREKTSKQEYINMALGSSACVTIGRSNYIFTPSLNTFLQNSEAAFCNNISYIRLY
ncbi:hypothetical protein D3C86_1798850 [compost metagenome]